ncbi:hypothetical protein BLA24_00180 [Streptomyces cinnamoneus]|uniref:Uncharacterized protein n=1 Tax=Streptomyces cinnamoneus TaxID=53446 RepID=A0A2G1XQS1_STRCJ|nr:hypothetical protein BLA24_00180 [Streptomyces cinnamoneus]
MLTYKQPVDHRTRRRDVRQRFTLLHKSVDRPTVFYTSVTTSTPSPAAASRPDRRRQPAVAGVPLLHPVPPQPADWSKLDIWQRPRPAPLYQPSSPSTQELAGHRAARRMTPPITAVTTRTT